MRTLHTYTVQGVPNNFEKEQKAQIKTIFLTKNNQIYEVIRYIYLYNVININISFSKIPLGKTWLVLLLCFELSNQFYAR